MKNVALKMQLMYLEAWHCQDPLEELTTHTESAFQKTIFKMLHGHLVHVGETVIDLQILGCELHQNAPHGRAPL